MEEENEDIFEIIPLQKYNKNSDLYLENLIKEVPNAEKKE